MRCVPQQYGTSLHRLAGTILLEPVAHLRKVNDLSKILLHQCSSLNGLARPKPPPAMRCLEHLDLRILALLQRDCCTCHRWCTERTQSSRSGLCSCCCCSRCRPCNCKGAHPCPSISAPETCVYFSLHTCTAPVHLQRDVAAETGRTTCVEMA